jgi:hypothetical protein
MQIVLEISISLEIGMLQISPPKKTHVIHMMGFNQATYFVDFCCQFPMVHVNL